VESGWSNKGIEKFNAMHHLVSNDQHLHGEAFNKELLKVFQTRCKKSNVKQVDRYQNQSKKRKPKDDDFGNDGKSKQSTMVQL
jgi:hypothetical protein